MNCWLIKSEGACYSIDDLKKDKRTPWTGIRNFQARNYMRDGMSVGDLVLFYHSNGTPDMPAGIYGIAKVASKPHPDLTAADPKDEHYEPKNPAQWVCVDMQFVSKLSKPITLEEIKKNPQLSGMLVAKPGQRLSVMPVQKEHFEKVAEMGK